MVELILITVVKLKKNEEEKIDTPSGDMMMDENIQVASDPAVMDSLNELSLMLYRRPLSDLTDDEYEELQDFASQQSLKPGLIDEYRNYKYTAEEDLSLIHISEPTRPY